MADILSDSKNKVITTSNLTIRGHLLRWSDTAIQVSNISMVSTASLPTPNFPMWTVVLLLIGLPILGVSADSGYGASAGIAIGLLLSVIGGAGIAMWVSSTQDSTEQKYLHIFLNSGNVYSFIVRDQKFLQQVLQVFANIFESGTTNETLININTQVGEIRDHGVAVQLNVGR